MYHLHISFYVVHQSILRKYQDEKSNEEDGLLVRLSGLAREENRGPCMIRAIRSVSASANLFLRLGRGGRRDERCDSLFGETISSLRESDS
mmetsp:Transcript_16057/g.20793  ORF Transcript_16057/g.20793 Transcript_16057/m.20793 type:complete len:91 (-) Transcript_16057:799-1071(-)